MSISDVIIGRMRSDSLRFFANDNVSSYLKEGKSPSLRKSWLSYDSSADDSLQQQAWKVIL